MKVTPVVIEVAAQSLYSAHAARMGGADRIELCTALSTGGLTPDVGLLNAVLDEVPLPAHVLIRPRVGDFVYDSHEIKTMAAAIRMCRRLGAPGVVFGCLDRHGRVPPDQLRLLAEEASGMDITFHRAIDLAADWPTVLDLLVELQFDRVLTSGQAKSAHEGVPVIAAMREHVDGCLTIMPGAGIGSHNLEALIQLTGCREFHASAKRSRPLEGTDGLGLTDVEGRPQLLRWETDAEEVRRLVALGTKLSY